MTSTTPVNGATGIARDANLVIRFDEPMDRALTQAAFSVYSPATAGTFTWNAASTVLTFTHDDEVKHIAGLRKDPDVSNITFNLGLPDSWVRESSSNAAHPEWAQITLSRGISLSLQKGPTEYILGTDDFFVFQFSPTTPAPGSQSDTLWQIVRWTEIKP